MATLIRLGETWWPFFAAHMVELSLFILIVWGVDRWVRLDTGARYGLWLTALVKAFVPPLYALRIPELLASLPVASAVSVAESGLPAQAAPVPETASALPVTWSVWALCLWVGSALLIAGVTVWRSVRLHRSLRSARRVDLPEAAPGLRDLGRVRVYDQPDLRSPVLVGVLRPGLYLPEGWRDWSPEQLRGVIAHELDHLRSRDLWVLLFQALATALYGTNPLVWLMNRRLIHLRELRCDEAALRTSGASPVEYSRLLIAFLEDRRPAAVAAVCFNEQGTPLKTRFEHVLNFKEGAMGHSGWRRLVPIAVALIILPLSIREVRSQTPQTKVHAAGEQKSAELWVNAKGQLMLDLNRISHKDLTMQLDYYRHLKKVEALTIKADRSAPEGVVSRAREAAEQRGFRVTMAGPSPIPGVVDPYHRFERFFSGTSGQAPADGTLGIQDVDVKPVPTHLEAPVYPEAARKESRPAKVFVKLKVNVDGSVSDVAVLRGKEPFRQAAIEAVSQFRFRPAQQDGQPVAVWMTMPIMFNPDAGGLREASTTDAASGNQASSAAFTYRLLPNHPNPFNPETLIPYELARETAVKLEIYNELGQVVRTLVSEVQPAGRHQVRWDGRDSSGEAVASGTYYCRFTAGEFRDVKKMTLLR